MFLLLLFIIEKMEIALMSSTKGMGSKLQDINWMEYITPTLKNKYIAKWEHVYPKPRGIEKQKFTMTKVKAERELR